MDKNRQHNQRSDLNRLQHLSDCWLLKSLIQLEREALSDDCFEPHSTPVIKSRSPFLNLRHLTH